MMINMMLGGGMEKIELQLPQPGVAWGQMGKGNQCCSTASSH